MDSLPFADNTVDVVLAPLGVRPAEEEAVVPHTLKDLSIKEILRVLCPSGRAIIGTVRDAQQQLTSAALPGGVLVDRYGRIIVVHEDGSVSCLG